jgi:hypothetical protein
MRWRLLPVGANRQLAFGEYKWNETAQSFAGRALVVLTITDALIADITAFGSPELFPYFGLPDHLNRNRARFRARPSCRFSGTSGGTWVTRQTCVDIREELPTRSA